ncbi:protein S-acyltransferase 11-like [Nicotiana sylvestris]|uniref:S-acyltransferase n=1 Tax=Nicotiana sylvestris TaxID=4096 RepID=A0A1U7WY68_NICSY|nr:PREDICTED: protein S-acyltransferase 11-like [Nicotiana sylvestris]
MDFADSAIASMTAIKSRSSPSDDVGSPEEHNVASVSENHETTCWGCGLRVLVSPHVPAFKCFWCGAITNQNAIKHENQNFRWRRLRDRCFVSILIVFMLIVICGGIWAIYPVVFSVGYIYGGVHILIAIILSMSTLSTFSLSAFRSAGAPPNILWGSYPVVTKGALENYRYCEYCSKPKSPRAHHCRSCGMCVLDMDHHCPFIGNCVGAANHRHFVIFLISAIISMVYASIMSAYAAYHVWPPLNSWQVRLLNGAVGQKLLLKMLREIFLAFGSSMLFLPARGLVLVYLFIASVSIEIGLSVLLWQQLCFIYEGKTYLSHISAAGGDSTAVKDCQNFIRFFGCPYYTTTRLLPSFFSSKKRHKK